ncbi:MAG: T9SS type A sorting domain-containing protein [Bacteroidetes bacterium]|nr:T9SS type A sorting domain-containing protein [Bacteroidota bacterium]
MERRDINREFKQSLPVHECRLVVQAGIISTLLASLMRSIALLSKFQHSNIPIFQYSNITTYYPKKPHFQYFISIIAFFLLSGNETPAQEKLTGLSVNPVLIQYNKTHRKTIHLKSKATPDTLTLPLFDDFSSTRVVPDQNRWTDKDVFINTEYPVNPISIGVATFDAIDNTGALYENANSFSFEADHLTSKPIDLDYLASDNIYLSFYYQAGWEKKLSDTPEYRDSLVLEFYSPEDTLWHSVWSKSGFDSSTVFIPVIIPVTNEKFLVKGFRFRFKNWASLTTNNDDPGMVTNCDHWHIDYVILDKNRNPADTIPEDVAFVRPIQSLLTTYESMPWDHFREAFLFEMGAKIPIWYKNNDDLTRNVTREFQITDVYENSVAHSYTGGAANIDPWEVINYKSGLFYTYNTNNSDSALFEVKSYLITDDFDEKINDTVVYYQRFNNYFAYDNGSAESGWGIGDGEAAYQFKTYIPDSLRAIQIYFNQSFNGGNRISFTLKVWGDNEGKPGELLYSQPGEVPIYSDSLNQFITYTLDTTLYISGLFYIGWEQNLNTSLNVGFDFNRVSNNKLFYTDVIDQQKIWIQSATIIPGALMMRPVVGKSILASNYIEIPVKPLIIYPNPAKEFINISVPGETRFSGCRILIFNIYGKQVFSSGNFNKRISVERFDPGIYFVRITNNGIPVGSAKFIIIR